MFNIKKKKREDDLTYLKRVYSKILKKSPDSMLYLPLASVFYRNNSLDGAIKILQKELSENPRHMTAKSFLAFIYYEKGDIDKAIGLFNNVISNCPDNYTAHKTLVNCYIEKDDYKSALWALKISAGLFPSDKKIKDRIGQLEKKLCGTQASFPSKIENKEKSRNEIKDKITTDEQTKNFETRENKELPFMEKDNSVKDKTKDEIIATLDTWLKNIDKISHTG